MVTCGARDGAKYRISQRCDARICMGETLRTFIIINRRVSGNNNDEWLRHNDYCRPFRQCESWWIVSRTFSQCCDRYGNARKHLHFSRSIKMPHRGCDGCFPYFDIIKKILQYRFDFHVTIGVWGKYVGAECSQKKPLNNCIRPICNTHMITSFNIFYELVVTIPLHATNSTRGKRWKIAEAFNYSALSFVWINPLWQFGSVLFMYD